MARYLQLIQIVDTQEPQSIEGCPVQPEVAREIVDRLNELTASRRLHMLSLPFKYLMNLFFV